MAGNLERLHRDYTHAARRAHALEDGFLPAIDGTPKSIHDALEDLER